MRSAVIFIAIIVTVYVPLALLDYAHFPFSDGAEHGAAVKELAKNLLHPEDPMLAHHPGDSPRFVPSTLVMAFFMRLLHLNVMIILKIFLVVFFALFLVAATLFSREYFNDPGQAPWSLASLLFLWGLGWTGANAYMFSAILYTAYFPSVVSFSLALLALYCQLRFLHCAKNAFLIGQIMLSALAFVNHPLTGIFFFICSALLYIEEKAFEKKMILWYVLSLVAALTLTGIWPYYRLLPAVFKLASGGMDKAWDYQATRHYLYSQLLLRSGPALAALPLLILFILQKRYLFLAGGFVIFCAIYGTGYFLAVSLAERFIFFIMFILQLTLARICREWFSLARFPLEKQNIRKIIVCLPVLLLATGIIIQAGLVSMQFIHPVFRFKPGSPLPTYVNPNTMQSNLQKYLTEGDVVLSDIYTSWSIPVYTGAKIIALFHTPAHIKDNAARIRDLEAFYDPSTNTDAKKAILKKYSVTHVLLNFSITGRGELEAVMKTLGLQVIAKGELFCLFAVP